MTKEYSVTLSQAHKIAARLGTAASEIKSQVISLSAPISMSGYTADQIAQLGKSISKVMGLIETHRLVLRSQAHVREMIASKNQKISISEILGKIEANKKIIGLLDEVLEAQNTNGLCATHYTSITTYQPIGGTESTSSFGRMGVTVTMLNSEMVESLTTQKQSLVKENFRANDDLAALNVNKVSVQLEDAIASLAGLD